MIGRWTWLAALAVRAASAWAVPPDWVVSGKSPSHPSALYVVGSGSSTESVDLARQAAMADVVRQIRARIKSSSEDEHWESSSSGAGNRRGESSWTGAQIESNEQIDGIQIAETAQDGPTWYALAVLDRSAFAAPGRTSMREAQTDARERLETSIQALANRQPLVALEALRQIELDRSKFSAGRLRAALGEPEALSEGFAIAPSLCDSLRRELVLGIQLRRGKDSIETGPDKIWPESAGLFVGFRNAPVTGLGIDLFDPSGQILGSGKTDSTGFAPVHPTRFPASTTTGWSRWSLRPRMDLSRQAELGLMVRMVGSAKPIRLAWTPHPTVQQASKVLDRLASAGWTTDSLRGTVVHARFQATPKGEIQGFSGTLLRFEARLTLTRGAARFEVAGVGTGPTEEKALENAIARLVLPVDALQDLLTGR